MDLKRGVREVGGLGVSPSGGNEVIPFSPAQPIVIVKIEREKDQRGEGQQHQDQLPLVPVDDLAADKIRLRAAVEHLMAKRNPPNILLELGGAQLVGGQPSTIVDMPYKAMGHYRQELRSRPISIKLQPTSLAPMVWKPRGRPRLVKP